MATLAFFGKTEKLFKIITNLATTQTDAKDEVIYVITTMCDTLESASDIVIAEISGANTDVNRARRGTARQLSSCFPAQAARFRHDALLGKLKAGKVCGDLKKLGKRFGDPLSPQAAGAQEIGDWIRTLFGRASSMQIFVYDLYLDERRYIEDFRKKLDRIATLAEQATAETDRAKLLRSADRMKKLLGTAKKDIRTKTDSLRRVADDCLDKLP